MDPKHASTQIINFDFVGSCRGSCPSCTLSEAERVSEEPFLTGEQMVSAIREVLAGKDEPSFLAVGVGRANVLALDPSSHGRIFSLVAQAKALAPSAHRVVEISTSLIESPAKQRANALAIMRGVAKVDPEAECRLVVVLDISQTSQGYWNAVERFMSEMSDWRGGGDGSGDILVLNLGIDALPPVGEVLRRVRRWQGPVNVQWLASGERVEMSDQLLLGLADWLKRFFDGAILEELDCNLVNVAQTAVQSADDLPVAALANQLSRLAWVTRDGFVHQGAFTMLGDYAAAASVDPKTVAARMFRHVACRGCEQLRSCIRCGGFAPALEVLRRGGVSQGVCPSGLIHVLEQVSAQNR
jgi:hypothetical protein